MSVMIRLTLGVAMLAFVVSRADLSGLTLQWGPAAWAGLASAVVLMVIALAASAVRWRLVLGPGAPALSFLCRLYFVGWFFSLFLPTSVGGDAVRTVALSRATTSAGGGLGSVVLERLLGVGALAAFLALGAVVAPSSWRALVADVHVRLPWWTVLAALPLTAVTLLFVRACVRSMPMAARASSEAMQLWRQFRRSPTRIVGAFGVSLVVQGCYILAWLTLAASLGLHVPLRDMLVFVPFVSLAAMLPITLSGLGVREGVWVLLLAPLGIAGANAIGFSLSYYAANGIVGILGGVVFAVLGTDAAASQSASPHVLSHDGVASGP